MTSGTGPRAHDSLTGDAVISAALPNGWSPTAARLVDIPELHALLNRQEIAIRGRASTIRAAVEAEISPAAGPTSSHLLVRDDATQVRAWASATDRAAGRTVLSVVVDHDLEPTTADTVADALFTWAAKAAGGHARARGLDVTQLDSGAYVEDGRQQRWLERAGFVRARTWLQMSRPVTEADGDPGTFPEPHPTVVIRRVRRSGDGMPDQDDLVTVHDILEEAFTDHFNYHAETFDEFLKRLRADPGHRWDHWWVAEIVDEPGAAPRPAGALLGAVSPGAGGGPEGSYVEYLGVLRAARGRGVARSLLHTIIADAAARGRNRVGLEVDADSPTGAVGLYTSTGFATSYSTQSWHRQLSTST
ncbi:GNAT family N-acetyltransferase [Georgenia subflava]|uniref:GNAT family N-acetyltransferase n=1 Tax=Georgenia subflava TaxID=1622177 RepID=A0A6N7EHY1_9MICO|nr:N-acetyltransferase [Georgenia subflava]MPV36327.1 GNAT family N-acetyltransferase [Georgenia subflava]